MPSPPRPDDWRVAVWRRFLTTQASVVRELERDTDLPLAWYDVLLQLAEAPGRRLRMAELADRVVLSRSGLSRLVDRLVAEGFVRRERSADDARGTYTVLLPAGVARFRRAVPAHLASIERHFLSRFDDDQLRELDALLARLE